MLRDRSFTVLLLVAPLAAFACSEGTEVDDSMMASDGDDDSSGGDDDTAADDDTLPADDDTAAGDAALPADDDTAPADDDQPVSGEPELLIDVTTATRDVAAYETTKEFLTETATLGVSEEEGEPPPSLRIELPFTNYNQFIEFQYLADQVNGGVYWNLEGKVLSFKLKVEAQGYTDLMCPGGIRVFIKTGDAYNYAGRSWYPTPEASDAWLTVDFDLSAADPGDGLTADDIDLTDVRSLGFGFESADCGAMFAPGDPPPETDPPNTAVFYMDDILVRNAGL
jgi:hypothetical protein